MDPPADGEGHRVLEVPAHGEQNGQLAARENRPRGQAARPAQDLRAAVDHGRHAVVHVTSDRAVVDEKALGDRAEPLDGLSFVGADGLLRQVAARGDEWEIDAAQQQVMQRRVGQHHAQIGVARRHVGVNRCVLTPRQQHDR